MRKSRNPSKLLAHLVFVVKYRRSVISESVWSSIKYGFSLATKRLDFEILEGNHDKNHVHLIVDYPPKISVSNLANALKGNSSYVVRRDCREEIKNSLWGCSFWGDGFFTSSCGDAPLEKLKLYVQSQKAFLKDGVSTHIF